MDKYIGRLLDRRYEIIELIGSGGMANVYRASDHRLGRMVAVKILKEEMSRDPEFRRRFHAESQAIAMLSHTNIVNVFDVSHSEEADYIVMELIDGLTLKDYLQSKGAIKWRETLHFTMQIAKALEHAHSRGIIHRDIKPHNIMILKDGSVKVADFGIARVASSQNTLTREALGSVHYISPEQARGAAADQRSDLYSLGVVMYEMLAGRPPYDGETPVAVAIQHINGNLHRPSEYNPTIPAGLEQIVLRLMEVSPDRRYPNATALLQDLEQFRMNPTMVFGQPAAPAQPAARSQPQPGTPTLEERRAARRRAEEERRRKNRRTAMLAGTAAILVILLLLGWFVYNYFLRDLFAPGKIGTIPSFVGTQFEALDPARYPDLTFEENWIYDDTSEVGTILDQTPKAGKEYKTSATVTLTISSGTQTQPMPNVIGQSRAAAQKLLEGLDLTLTVQYEEVNHESVTVGYVIGADVPVGTPLHNGDTVILSVSLGPKTEEMSRVPPLVGCSMEQALQLLEENGLKRGAVQYIDSEEPEGTILFQGISDGKEVAKGTEINLQVSRGMPAPPEQPEPTEPVKQPDSLGPNPEQPQPDEPEQTEDESDEPEQPIPEPEPNPEQPPVPVERSVDIEIPLPEQEGTVEVVMQLDGETIGSFVADCEDLSFSAHITGTGSKVLTVYFDGVASYSEMIHFDE